MSEGWQYYLCKFGDHTASVMVDTDAGKTLRDSPAICAQIRLYYKAPDEHGLPTNDEFDTVCKIEDALEAFADASNDHYVGRITSNGSRTFYIYSRRDETEWDRFANELADRFDYEFAHRIVADADYKMYWDELYPNAIAWREIADGHVVENLNKHGDDGTTERPIDHWAYFPSEQAARPFIDWAVGERFSFQGELSGVIDDGKYCVRLQHMGPAKTSEVSRYTVRLMQKALEFDGEYDGWETQVVSARKQ